MKHEPDPRIRLDDRGQVVGYTLTPKPPTPPEPVAWRYVGHGHDVVVTKRNERTPVGMVETPLYERMPPPADELEALTDVLQEELGWDWHAAPREHVPSGRSLVRDLARVALDAIQAGRVPGVGVTS